MKSVTPLTLVLALAIAAWGEAGPVALFNGSNLEGWTHHPSGASNPVENTWSVKEGVLHCTGSPAGYLRTRERYSNYKLTVEWRWPAGGGNNGVLVHVQEPDEVWPKSIEAQLEHGHAGDIWVIGGADFKEHQGVAGRRVAKQEASSEKPLGEWNTYIIVARGDRILLYVNGVLQNVATECTLSEGFVALQSEGTPIEFRKVELQLLKETAP